MSEFRNELSWSASRHKVFSTCQRRYYYQHYGSQNGWDRNASEEARLIYRLRYMSNCILLAGNVVHDSIGHAMVQWQRKGIEVPEDQLLQYATGRWNVALRQSAAKGWMHDPKRLRCLFEDLYVEEPDRTRLKEEALLRAHICLTNFLRAESWGHIRRSRPHNWLLSDLAPFTSAAIPLPADDVHPPSTIPLFARPDFVCRIRRPAATGDICQIIDWKTGAPNDGDDFQMRFYALFAQEVWGFSCSNIRVRLVYLHPEHEEWERTFTEDHLVAARNDLHKSVMEMKRLLADVATNVPHPIEHFEFASHQRYCSRCSFHSICPKGDRANWA